MAVTFTANGIAIAENGTEEWAANGVQIGETTAVAPPAGTANPLIMGATNLMAGKLAV